MTGAFGIFLTPVFFFVIQWFSDRRGPTLPDVDGESVELGPLSPGRATGTAA